MCEGRMSPTKKVAPSAKKGNSFSFRTFLSDLRKKRIIEILAAFIAGGWLIVEFVDRILVAHYHFPDKTIDITFVTLLGILLCALIWRWFSGREAPRKFKLELVLIPLVLLVILLLDINLLLHLKGPEPEAIHAAKWKNSIAVLPFVDMSPQKDQDWFCDGITDEIIGRLSNISELKVPARTSVFYFKGKNQDIKEIGQKLGVATVLEGSIQKVETRLRARVQLINIADGFHVWSQEFDRELKDVFAVQDEIALAVADKLRIQLLGEERARVVKRYTDNTDAYDSYMRGMWLLNNKITEEAWRTAILHFERAIEIDPDFSLAYVGTANAYINLSIWHYVSSDGAIPKAKKPLEHALKIDPQLSEALAWSGEIKSRFEYNFPGGESDIRRALELNPNYGLAHLGLANILACEGKFDKAIEESSAGLELDPLSLYTQGYFAFNLYLAGRYDDAIRQCRKSLELDPEYPLAFQTLGRCFVQKSLFPEAIAAIHKAVVSSGNSTEELSYLAYAYVASGNLEKAHEILRELDTLSKHAYVSKYHLAYVHAALGDKDRAFELLELAYKERDVDLFLLKVDVRFATLRSDPRYEMMLKKIGLEK
jgi:adenylate cyclase